MFSMYRLKHLVDQCANMEGPFRQTEISKRQRKLYKRHKIVPMEFLIWLKESGYHDVIDVFESFKNSMRTIPVVFAYMQSRHKHKNGITAFEDAVGRQTGNFRYHVFHGRERPEKILNGMCDQLM